MKYYFNTGDGRKKYKNTHTAIQQLYQKFFFSLSLSLDFVKYAKDRVILHIQILHATANTRNTDYFSVIL